MRKEISQKTNMSEKAVRIWFQNRRAKLRKFERMGRSTASATHLATNSVHNYRNGSMHSSRSNLVSLNNDNSSQMSPQIPYHASMGFGASAGGAGPFGALPIEVNEKYCFIDVLSLSVGSWQRIKLGYHDENAFGRNLVNLSPFTVNNIMPNVDLLVILLKKNFEINYFFSAISNNAKILFRIFYPISSIITCSLLDNNINKDNNELRICLSHKPKFSVYFFNGVNSNSNQWLICDDFSEDQQVSLAYSSGGNSIPHVLVGVKNSLQYLNLFILENNQFPVQTPVALSQSQQYHSFSNNNRSTSSSNTPAHLSEIAEQKAFDPDELWDDSSFKPIEKPHDDALGYRLLGFLPLGDLDLETSPNSITSSQSHIPHLLHETTSALNSNRNSRTFHNERFSKNKHLDGLFDAEISSLKKAYSHLNLDHESGVNTPLGDHFNMLAPFDLTLQNTDFDPTANTITSPDNDTTNNHVDSFIDFNSHY